jgi:hypothetical protein
MLMVTIKDATRGIKPISWRLKVDERDDNKTYPNNSMEFSNVKKHSLTKYMISNISLAIPYHYM